MKTLKKHPKQQRMEDMKFPGSDRSVTAGDLEEGKEYIAQHDGQNWVVLKDLNVPGSSTKYRFIGKPDVFFPNLVTGQTYDLKVVFHNGKPLIVSPITCPYSSKQAFDANWKKEKFPGSTLTVRMWDGKKWIDKTNKQNVYVRTGNDLVPYKGNIAKKTIKGENWLNAAPKLPDSDFFIDKNGNTTVRDNDIKKIWTGREYLRSINDDRHGWHVLAVGILIVAVAVSAYLLSHGLVCAPASLGGKSVINCRVK